MTTQRIYIVRPRIVEAGQPIPERLVRATGVSQARRHIVRGFIVGVASQDDLVSALERNVPIESASGADPKSAVEITVTTPCEQTGERNE
jgi:hypothetical protein